MHGYVRLTVPIHESARKWCCNYCCVLFMVVLAFQIDVPTLVTETLGREGLKHLEMYLKAKEKGDSKKHFKNPSI